MGHIGMQDLRKKDDRVFASHITTISVEPKILGEFGLLKLKTFSLYHENLIIQNFNDMYTQGLTYFFSASDIMEAVRGRFYGMNAI